MKIISLLPLSRSSTVKSIVNLLFTFSLVFSTFLNAAIPSNVSPAQIAQFKSLPKSQQQALAKSMGVDLNAVMSSNGSQSNTGDTTSNQYLAPKRDVTSDENENLDEFNYKKEALKPFGYDVFAYEPLNFAPSIDIAVPESYLVGPGDTLSIQLFGKENQDYTFEVSREGTILLPRLGPFRVAGMTFAEVKAFLTNQVKEKVIGVQVVVTLSKLRSIRVFVLGDAYKPGSYVLSALSSMTHAIFAAGGINEIGSLRNVQLKRSGKLVGTLDLYDLLVNGDSTGDLMLKSGDVIFIAPVGQRVSIDGQVTRPAIYEISENDTFANVLKMSGGLLPSAFPAKSVVERFNDKRLRTIQNIDLTNKKSLQEKVKGGDYIKVLKTSDLYQNTVTLYGAVTRPGKYQWQENQKISDLLPNIHGALLDNADLAYGIVVREKDAARNIELHQFSLFNIVSDVNATDNLTLQPHDKILVFSNENEVNEILNTSNLALTEQELSRIEKHTASEKYKEGNFWKKVDPSRVQNDDLDNDTFNASLIELTGEAQEEKVNINQYHYFSRERMLAPFIDKLKQQARSGDAIQLVEVIGAVKFPGIYPLVVNGKVTDLVKAAGGLLESAYLTKSEVTRNQVVNGKAEKQVISVNVGEAFADNTNPNNIKLKSKDRLNVLQIPAWQENYVVELRGEFVFPGKYTIQRGETLAQLIERAGGYTEFAYTEGSLFTRTKLKQLEQINVEKMIENLRKEVASKSLSSESSNTDYQQVQMLLNDLHKVKPVGRLVLDLPKIEQGNNHDVLLENGDFLYVPSKLNSINVIGQVQLATTHMFNANLSVDDYVQLSGGTKQQADTDRIYVIKANGSVFIPGDDNWFTYTENKLEPGDSIIVPTDTDYMPNLKLWQAGTQIVYQSAVAIAAISSL